MWERERRARPEMKKPAILTAVMAARLDKARCCSVLIGGLREKGRAATHFICSPDFGLPL